MASQEEEKNTQNKTKKQMTVNDTQYLLFIMFDTVVDHHCCAT